MKRRILSSSSGGNGFGHALADVTQAAHPTSSGAPGAVAPRSTCWALTKLRPRLRRLPCSAQRRLGRRRQCEVRNRHRCLFRRQCPVWSRYGTTVGQTFDFSDVSNTGSPNSMCSHRSERQPDSDERAAIRRMRGVVMCLACHDGAVARAHDANGLEEQIRRTAEHLRHREIHLAGCRGTTNWETRRTVETTTTTIRSARAPTISAVWLLLHNATNGLPMLWPRGATTPSRRLASIHSFSAPTARQPC